MVALFIVAAEKAAGKTTIAAGLGKYFLSDGKKVGYLRVAGGNAAPDVPFMKQALSLAETADSLTSSASGVKEALARLAPGKDVVIIEGDTLDKTAYEIAEALQAKVLVVGGYKAKLMEFPVSYKGFGANLLGVILNKIPKSQLKRVAGEMSAQAARAEIKLLGVIPEVRALLALSIGELAGAVKGEILNNAEKSAELVENLMGGALCVDSGLTYFGRKTAKAAIVRDNRPDMMLAALETPTRCLVVSGETKPVYSIRYRAEDKCIPIIMTKSRIDAIVNNIEDALDNTRFNQPGKLGKLSEILTQNLDFKAIYSGLGLAGQKK